MALAIAAALTNLYISRQQDREDITQEEPTGFIDALLKMSSFHPENRERQWVFILTFIMAFLVLNWLCGNFSLWKFTPSP